MTELPAVAYRCPTCGKISDTVNHVVPIERTTPYRYNYREKTHSPDLPSVKNWEGRSEWRCLLCGSEIKDIERSLVDVFTSPLLPPDGIEIERDPEDFEEEYEGEGDGDD